MNLFTSFPPAEQEPTSQTETPSSNQAQTSPPPPPVGEPKRSGLEIPAEEVLKCDVPMPLMPRWLITQLSRDMPFRYKGHTKARQLRGPRFVK